MVDRVTRSISEPIREYESWEKNWKGPDKGLIRCWERGRELQSEQPDLAERALSGELPILGWRGGIEGTPKFKSKWGSLFYLAQWQGLRNEDLDCPLDGEESLVCARTGIAVTFTRDISRFGNG
ncbi:MAG: hypothetical protein R3E86_22100 [Pseudomonadales bacterium]